MALEGDITDCGALTTSELQTLSACEQTIDAGLKTFVAVGEALLTIRDQRLYRHAYVTFEEYCGERWGISRPRAYQMIDAAQVVGRLSTIVDIPIPSNEAQARPLASLPPDLQPVAWQQSVETANGKVTAAHVAKVVKVVKTRAEDDKGHEDSPSVPDLDTRQAPRSATPERALGVHFSSATPEWYTPRHIIERVLRLWDDDAVDLDPCSNAKGDAANVPARLHYTAEDDGLTLPWQGRVYLNPPYGNEIGAWVARLTDQYADHVEEAIALLPARTDTAWFQPLLSFPVCFVTGRLRFSGAENSAPFPSAIVYLGSDVAGFQRCFADIGPICTRLPDAQE